MNSKNSIQQIALVAIASFGAVYLGLAAARLDIQLVATVLVGVSALVAFIALGKEIWMVIPLFYGWNAMVYALPLPFSVSNVVVIYAALMSAILVATRRIRLSWRPDGLDLILFIQLLVLIVAYVRNPVGFSSFLGGANVGGRPYLELGMALCGYYILGSGATPLKLLNKLPVWSIWVAVVLAAGGAVAMYIPSAGIYLYQLYSGFKPSIGGIEGLGGRLGFLKVLASVMALFAISRKAPIQLFSLQSFKWMAMLGIATVFAAGTGHRIAIVSIGGYFIVSCVYHYRWQGVFFSSFMAVFTLIVVYLASLTGMVPQPIQRALTVFPGAWDPAIVQEADFSTEWRLEMWTEAWQGRGIENRIIGDGFAIPRVEMEYFESLMQGGNQLPTNLLAEWYLMTGDLHSGPLTAIKSVGIIGLLLFLLYMIMANKKYVSVLKKTDPEFKPLVLFFAIPIFFYPFFYVFLFGGYNDDFPHYILFMGMLKRISNSVDQHAYEATLDEAPNGELTPYPQVNNDTL